jgi:HD-like signal output (HDOD) protein
MIDSASTLDQLAERCGQLYSLPGVAMQVLQLTRNPHVDTRALKECIENDPAISSRILRVVNSSLFGLTREVSDLNQALALLGIKPLKLLVLGFSLPSGLFLDVEAKTLLWYWKHTLTKAVAGRELSHRLWRIPGDETFLAGLFQDLGVLVLFQQLGQPYARFLDRAVSHRLDLGAIQRRVLGFSHAELSARLLKQWNFPESLCEIIAWDPAQGNQPARVQILRLSELFAQIFADGQTSVLAELLESGRCCCRHLDRELEPLVLEIERKVEELADIFSLALPDGLEYRDVLAEAHRQMAQVATPAAGDLLRGRAAADGDPDDEWLFGEFDALSEALTAACAAPIEHEALARAGIEISAAGVGLRERPAAAALATARPGLFASPAPARARPIAGTVAPNLLDRLTGVVAACRQAHRPLSLLLVKLSAGVEMAAACPPQEVAAVRKALTKACAKLDHPGAICLPHADFGFALILPGAERQQAVELGGDLVHAVRGLAAGGVGQEWLKLDVGVATVAQPPRNFPPRDLLDGADRCLYASHASGGDVVKSIEIY